MINQKTVELIGSVINNLAEFVSKDDEVSKDFNSYLQMMGMQQGASVNAQKILMPYIFERRLTEDRKSVFEIYLEKKSLDKNEQKIVEALKENISSVYKVEKLLKIGFELFNIINEKHYPTYSMVKMTHLRGVGVGQYIIARIFPYDGDYYMLELNEIISQSQEEKAFRLAVAKQIQDPPMLYRDNPDKLKEIQSDIKKTGTLFEKFFGAKEVITINQKADQLLSLFNEFVEEGQKTTKKQLEPYIQEPTSLAYFDVSSASGDFIETAASGFASDNRPYDIGLVYDDELGLFVIPFLKTFRAIFEIDDYTKIEGWRECINHFLTSEKIPPFILKDVSSGDSKKFLKIVNDAMDESLKSFKGVEKKYKYEYLEGAKFSPTTVLYLSKAFSKLMGFANEEKSKVPANANVGRNDPCPCGSGKKYKKCCLR